MRSETGTQLLLPTSLNDPVRFAREVLHIDPWAMQEEIMRAVALEKRVAVRSCHHSGKCMGWEEPLPLADGRIVPAGSLVGAAFALLTFEKDGSQQPALAWAFDNGRKPVFRVTTDCGRAIVRTGNHPLLTAVARKYRGIRPEQVEWRTVESLSPHDLVAVPDALEQTGLVPQPEAHVKLAAYLLGDGGITNAISFTQEEGPAKDEVRAIAVAMGAMCNERNRLTFNVTCGNRGGKPNPVLDLVRQWGMFGTKSTHKRFPAWVWQLPNEQLALFLNRLFACDGWASLKPTRYCDVPIIAYASASEGLIRDLELALLRLGISGRIRRRESGDGTGSGRRFASWEWRTYSYREVIRFADVVGIYGKEGAVERVRQRAAAVSEHVSHKWPYRGLPSGYHWEHVRSVEAVGEQRTVGISVPGTHTYLTTFVEHNTHASAAIGLWWASTFNPSLVVTTAPTERQVKFLWYEIHQHFRQMNSPVRPGALSLELSPTQRLFGFSTNDAIKFQGLHSPHILVIVDEAAGVEPGIYESIEGILTGTHAHLLLIGNPNNASGTFYDAFSSELYRKFHIEASDVPAHLLPPDWAEERLAEWGEESPAYQVRVMGNFPSQGEDSLISMSWVQAAQERVLEPEGDLEIGVDISRYGGDESVAYLRQGPVVLGGTYWRGQDTMVSAGRIAALCQEHAPAVVKVDEIGIGAGVVDRLSEEGAPVVGVNVGEKAWDSEHFANRRSEIFWGLRERFRDGEIVIPEDDTLLVAQLVALKFSYTPKGQIKLQSKEDMRKERTGARAWQSPDRADALALCMCAADGFTPGVVVGEGRGWSS